MLYMPEKNCQGQTPWLILRHCQFVMSVTKKKVFIKLLPGVIGEDPASGRVMLDLLLKPESKSEQKSSFDLGPIL